jgi:hypothetical protein
MAEVRVNEKNLRNFGRDALRKGMTRAMLVLQGQVQRKLSVGQPVRRTSSGRQVGLDPSLPGQPPRVVSGNLRKSITNSVAVDQKGVVGKVGTNVPYGRRLELGFFGVDKAGRNYSQEARPYLRPALKENFRRLVDIITGRR